MLMMYVCMGSMYVCITGIPYACGCAGTCMKAPLAGSEERETLGPQPLPARLRLPGPLGVGIVAITPRVIRATLAQVGGTRQALHRLSFRTPWVYPYIHTYIHIYIPIPLLRSTSLYRYVFLHMRFSPYSPYNSNNHSKS